VNACNCANSCIILYMHNSSATSLQLLQQFYFKFYHRCNIFLLQVASACFMFFSGLYNNIVSSCLTAHQHNIGHSVPYIT